MDAQLKAKWVAALRSGEYRQAQGRLHDSETDSYCCLGVLCKVVGAEWGSFKKEVESEDGFYIATREHVPIKDGKLLGDTDGEELEAWACHEFDIPDQRILMRMNDGKGKEGSADYERPKTFSEIADYIEKHL